MLLSISATVLLTFAPKRKAVCLVTNVLIKMEIHSPD